MSTTTEAPAEGTATEPELQRSLKPRHMTMISLGGVIGAEYGRPCATDRHPHRSSR